MSKKKAEEVPELQVVEAPQEKVSAPVRRTVLTPRKAKLVSFDVWAKKRNVKEHHKGGMRAFVKNPNQPRTEEVWDKLFTDY